MRSSRRKHSEVRNSLHMTSKNHDNEIKKSHRQKRLATTNPVKSRMNLHRGDSASSLKSSKVKLSKSRLVDSIERSARGANATKGTSS